MPGKRIIYQSLALLSLLGMTLTLYWPALGGPLLFDDYTSIEPLLELRPFPADWRAHVMSSTGPLGRPVSMLTFLANLCWSGDTLWAWKFTNLLLHCAVAGLLFALAKKLFSVCLPAQRDRAAGLAVFVTAVWLVHPLHPSTVLYTVQRMTQLSALFTAAGMLCYLSSRSRADGSRITRLLLWSPYLVFLPLAALSKETGLLLPLFLAVLDVTVLRDRGPSIQRQQAFVLHLVFLVVPLVLGVGYFVAHFDTALAAPYLRRGFTLGERLLTESRVLVQYLVQIVLPSRQRLGFFHDDTLLSTSLLSPPTTAVSIVALCTLLSAAWRWRQRAPLFACGILWFFAGHAMEASVVPLELMFEHRNYLPSFGIILAIVGAAEAAQSSISVRLNTRVVGCVVVGLSMLVTHSIVNDWRNEKNLYAAAYQAHPRSPSAAAQFAEEFTAQQRYDEARAVLAPLTGAGAEIHRWYLECRQRGAISAARLDLSVLMRERTLTTYAVTGLIEIANLGLDDRCRYSQPRFLALLSKAVNRPTVMPDNRQKLMIYHAHFAWKAQMYSEALANLEQAQAFKPADPTPLFLMSEWKMDRHDTAGAMAALQRAEALASNSRRDYSVIIARVRTRVNEQKVEAPR